MLWLSKFLVLLLILVGCRFKLDNGVAPMPIASFSYTLQGDGTVFFDNSSERATTYLWDFGDGTSSNQVSPTHAFPGHGPYVVNLTAYSTSGPSHASVMISLYDFSHLGIWNLKRSEISVCTDPSNNLSPQLCETACIQLEFSEINLTIRESGQADVVVAYVLTEGSLSWAGLDLPLLMDVTRNDLTLTQNYPADGPLANCRDAKQYERP